MPIPLVTRILVADDYPIVRSGLKKVLDAEPDLEVVAEAEDGAEAVEKALSEDIRLGHPRRLDATDDRHSGRGRTAQAQAGAEDADALDARQRAVPVRGAEGWRFGLRAEVRRRHRHRRGVSGGDAR